MESNDITTTTTFTDSIVFDVIKDIAKRAEAGLAKYNTTMDREDLITSDWVQHAYEEALDMAIYLKRLRKDMLLMEEELRAYKLRDAIREKAVEDALKKGAVSITTTSGTGFTTSGTGFVCTTTTSKPNETYTDEEPNIKKRYANHR